MIDWVSIVRHSRRRFSNYMYAGPSRVRRRRKKPILPAHAAAASSSLAAEVKGDRKNEEEEEEEEEGRQGGLVGLFYPCDLCGCLPKKYKSRYDDSVPPVSASQMIDMSSLDGVPRNAHNHDVSKVSVNVPCPESRLSVRATNGPQTTNGPSLPMAPGYQWPQATNGPSLPMAPGYQWPQATNGPRLPMAPGYQWPQAAND
ncbi:uncharacterized protein LOC121878570 [Homarus americanus]|uniref:uncharacterized protein LOC121878570 n=1 Tax=Homarus americanus TaxID=6706 RepID=UPI001C476B18|nr:uncharacterized protein LOC121878570 [Homarus americanus]